MNKGQNAGATFRIAPTVALHVRFIFFKLRALLNLYLFF
jgi:hypothetical protein